MQKSKPKEEIKVEEKAPTKKCSFCEKARQTIKNIFWFPTNGKL